MNMVSRKQFLPLIGMALLVIGCVRQETPQTVTDAFWASVISNDAKRAVQYSTLTDVRQYDGFSRNWRGFQPQSGRSVIEGDEARVATRLSQATDNGTTPLEFVTFLVRQGDQWKVDYGRTGEAVSGGAWATLFGDLSRLARQVSGELEARSKMFSGELARIGKQLQELSDSLGSQAKQRIELHGEAIRKSIEALAKSIERALKEQQERLPDKDRRALQEVVADLNADSKRLSRPTIQSVAESGVTLAVARERLESVDSAAIRPYSRQWRAWEEKIEDDFQKMVVDLSTERE